VYVIIIIIDSAMRVFGSVPYITIDSAMQVCGSLPYITIDSALQVCRSVPYITIDSDMQVCERFPHITIYRVLHGYNNANECKWLHNYVACVAAKFVVPVVTAGCVALGGGRRVRVSQRGSQGAPPLLHASHERRHHTDDESLWYRVCGHVLPLIVVLKFINRF